jgi:hypothetical protein
LKFHKVCTFGSVETFEDSSDTEDTADPYEDSIAETILKEAKSEEMKTNESDVN